MDEDLIIDDQGITEVNKSRPIAITVICVLGFIGVLFVVPIALSAQASAIANWYPPYLIFASIVGIICFIALWKMKAWGVYTYALFVVVNQITLITIGLWTISSLAIPAIVVAIGVYYLKDMS